MNIQKLDRSQAHSLGLEHLFLNDDDHVYALGNDEVEGHIAVRVIHGLLWVTDLKCWSENKSGAWLLMATAREQVKLMGYQEYRLSINTLEPSLFNSIIKSGHEVESIVFRGKIRDEG